MRDVKRSGRNSIVTPEIEDKLKIDIEKTPAELGYESNVWSGKLLSHHLKKVYGIKISVRQCQRLFHKLDFSPEASTIGSTGMQTEKRN